MAEVSVRAPTRDELGMVFEVALSGAKTERVRALVARVTMWHELTWDAQDKVVAKQQGGQQPGNPLGAKVDESAAERHGVDSPDAQAMRDARKQARLSKGGGGKGEGEGMDEATPPDAVADETA